MSRLKKAVYIGNGKVNVAKPPTFDQAVNNAKTELGKAFDWATGKKKKKPGVQDVNG